MATLSATQIYAALRRAGFSPAKAVIMTAVSLGESGGRSDAQGDTSIQTDKWGPSYGLFAIRTLKSETGSGGYRDIVALSASIEHQAKAAYAISSGGGSFTPWTVFTSGGYREHLGQAQRAALAVGDSAASISIPGWAADAGGGLSGLVPGQGLEGIVTSVRSIVATSTFVLAGIVLVIVGATVAARRRKGVQA